MRIDLDPWQIRSFRPDDAPSLARYANNRNVWLNVRDAFPHPYRIEDAVAWIRMAARQYPEVSFAIADATEVIGTIGLGLQTDVNYRSAEIGYWLGEPFWGQGIATAALTAMTELESRPAAPARARARVSGWSILPCALTSAPGRYAASAPTTPRPWPGTPTTATSGSMSATPSPIPTGSRTPSPGSVWPPASTPKSALPSPTPPRSSEPSGWASKPTSTTVPPKSATGWANPSGDRASPPPP